MTRAATFNPIRAIDPPHAAGCLQTLIEVDGEYFIISINLAGRETVAFRATADGKFASEGTGEPDLFDVTWVGGTDAVALVRCVAQLLAYLRTAPTVQAVPLDADGYPYREYADDVCAALQKLDIRAHTPHYEGPWERQVMLPATGAYAGRFAVWLCWMADQSDPARGEGWFIAHDETENGPTRITRLDVAHHATPEQVAAAVAPFLLDAAPADAQATPTAPEGGDQGDEPDRQRALVDAMAATIRDALPGVTVYAAPEPLPTRPHDPTCFPSSEGDPCACEGDCWCHDEDA